MNVRDYMRTSENCKGVRESGRALYIRAGSTCECVRVTRYDTSQRSGVHAKGGARPLQHTVHTTAATYRHSYPGVEPEGLRAPGLGVQFGPGLCAHVRHLKHCEARVNMLLFFLQRKAASLSSFSLTFCKLN